MHPVQTPGTSQARLIDMHHRGLHQPLPDVVLACGQGLITAMARREHRGSVESIAEDITEKLTHFL